MMVKYLTIELYNFNTIDMGISLSELRKEEVELAQSNGATPEQVLALEGELTSVLNKFGHNGLAFLSTIDAQAVQVDFRRKASEIMR